MKVSLFIFLLLVPSLDKMLAQQKLLGGLVNCFPLPPINPSSGFLANFDNPCYATPMNTSRGGHELAGDLNTVYELTFYKVTPGYELVITGTYPNARFFSIAVYDGHGVQTAGLFDNQIPPLKSSMSNPFLLNATYTPNQLYGATIGWGSPLPTTVSPGCSTSGTTIDQNFLDASQIHQGLSWNGYPGLPANFPVHMTGPNPGGYVIVRSYYDISLEPPPVLIVRNLTTGCAVPVRDTNGIITNDPFKGNNWGDSSQTSAHKEFAQSIQPKECFPPDPQNGVQWGRSPNYIPGYNAGAAYLHFYLTPSQVKSIRSGNQFIQMRFQIPVVPDTPCTTGACSLTGQEQLRYRSISFLNGHKTLASLKDDDFVKDPYGNVDLIVGMGTPPPSYVTPENYYTYFDLSRISGYENLSVVTMRDILPNPTFQCSSFNVPFFYSEYNPEGGYMGNYVPTVGFPVASQIPQLAAPITRPNTCSALVTQQPMVCSSGF